METGLVTINVTPEAQELIAFAGTFLRTAQAITITTPDEAQIAVDQTKAIKECAKAVDETRKGYTTPLDEQKKAYMDLFRPAVDGLAQAEGVLKGVIGAWNVKVQAEAAAALKEQQRLQDIERKRQEAEQATAADLLAQAEQATAAGDYAAAEALEERAAQAQEIAAPVAVIATVAPVKPRGAATRTIWKCQVVDPSKLDRAYLMPNQAVLDALAATAKGVGEAPTGCQWASTTSTSIRSPLIRRASPSGVAFLEDP